MKAKTEEAKYTETTTTYTWLDAVGEPKSTTVTVKLCDRVFSADERKAFLQVLVNGVVVAEVP